MHLRELDYDVLLVMDHIACHPVVDLRSGNHSKAGGQDQILRSPLGTDPLCRDAGSPPQDENADYGDELEVLSPNIQNPARGILPARALRAPNETSHWRLFKTGRRAARRRCWWWRRRGGTRPPSSCCTAMAGTAPRSAPRRTRAIPWWSTGLVKVTCQNRLGPI